MKSLSFLKSYSLLFIALLLSSTFLKAQVDCSTPNGILALMMAGAITGTPQDVDNTGSSTLTCTASSKLFAAAQTTRNTGCESRIKMHIYYSTVQNALSNLPNLSTVSNWAMPANVKKVSATFVFNSNNINVYSCSGTIPRTGLTQGQTVYYRWAKEIAKDNDVDPWVWSSTLTFVVTPAVAPPPPPPALPDLRASGMNQLLYCKDGGNVGDGTFTYHALSQNFCSSLPQAGFTASGALPATFGSASGTPIMKLDFPLPNIAFGIKNFGTANAGASQVQIFKGSSNTPVSTQAVGALAAGASTTVTLTGRGVATVYRFPGFDGTDSRFCYVKEELNHTFPATLETGGYKVKVDSGNAVTEGTTGESNNQRTYNCGTSVIIIGN
ncbi:MAG: hypothetical protein K1X92_01815 [Bacteroidia bacterium]|nr:hypothetical protein [Bacteroidia bacterium]